MSEPNENWEHAELLSTYHDTDKLLVLERHRRTGEYRQRIVEWSAMDETGATDRRSMTDAQ